MMHTFYAGDTITVPVPEAPSGGTVTLILSGEWVRKSYPASGGTVTIPAADTAPMSAGVYKYVVRLTAADGTVRTADAGTLLLESNPERADLPAETRSVNRRILDALIDTLNRRATDDVLERSVDGVTLKYATSDQLTGLIDKYQMRVDAEEGRDVLPGSVSITFR